MKPLSLTFAQNTCKRNRKGAGQKYSARRLCRSFVAFMLSQSCSLVKSVGTYFVHVCRKCCTISPKSTCKIVHHVGAGHTRPAAYRHILFTIQSVGEGFIPPTHLPPPQTATASRGLAALQPHLKPVRRAGCPHPAEICRPPTCTICTFPQIYSFFCKKIYQKISLCAIISSNSLFPAVYQLKEDHPCPT